MQEKGFSHAARYTADYLRIEELQNKNHVREFHGA